MDSYEIQKSEKIYENEGYVIAIHEQYATSDYNGREIRNYICLGYNPNSKMWVTWESTDMVSYFWGHYFDRRLHALIDYHRRLTENYENQAF